MASSSRPNASACSGVRSVLGCDMVEPPGVLGLKGNVDVADGDGHTNLHVLVGRGRHRTSGQVAHDTAGFATCAGMADTHPASTLRGETGRFGLLEKRAAIVDDLNIAV